MSFLWKKKKFGSATSRTRRPFTANLLPLFPHFLLSLSLTSISPFGFFYRLPAGREVCGRAAQETPCFVLYFSFPLTMITRRALHRCCIYVHASACVCVCVCVCVCFASSPVSGGQSVPLSDDLSVTRNKRATKQEHRQGLGGGAKMIDFRRNQRRTASSTCVSSAIHDVELEPVNARVDALTPH